MKNKLLLTLLTTCGILAAQAEIYVEPRVSYLAVGGSPDIGDIGHETGTDRSSPAVSLAVGYVFTPRLSLELRYSHLGDLTVFKESPTWQIFPPDGEVTLPAVRLYDLVQRTELFSVAARFRVWSGDKLSVSLTPMLQIESSEVKLLEAGISPPLPYVTLVPAGTVITRRTDTEVQPGAEISIDYQFSERIGGGLHYTYSPLSTYDAHLIGAGLIFKF